MPVIPGTVGGAPTVQVGVVPFHAMRSVIPPITPGFVIADPGTIPAVTGSSQSTVSASGSVSSLSSVAGAALACGPVVAGTVRTIPGLEGDPDLND